MTLDKLIEELVVILQHEIEDREEAKKLIAQYIGGLIVNLVEGSD